MTPQEIHSAEMGPETYITVSKTTLEQWLKRAEDGFNPLIHFSEDETKMRQDVQKIQTAALGLLRIEINGILNRSGVKQ
jgi:hypothetical protein